MEYIVYVKTKENGYIVAVNSSAFLNDLTDWIKIDEGYGDRYYHAQGNYFDQPIMDENGVYRYKLVAGAPVECTAEEIAAQERAFNRSPVPVAPRNIVVGEYVTVNGVLYEATMNTPNGETIIVGQNAVVTTVEEQLYKLTKGE